MKFIEIRYLYYMYWRAFNGEMQYVENRKTEVFIIIQIRYGSCIMTRHKDYIIINIIYAYP